MKRAGILQHKVLHFFLIFYFLSKILPLHTLATSVHFLKESTAGIYYVHIFYDL